MTGRMVVAMIAGALLCSGSDGQVFVGTDWLDGLSANIDALNRNIQQNVQQLNERIQETVQGNLEQVREMTKNLKEELATARPATVQAVGSNNVILSSNDGTKIVQSGRTSDGKPYVRETTDKIVGDTLRHVERIYDPTTNSSKVHGYTLDLKDPNAKPVPINDAA
ncbi:PREDICTED: uncharacterized protein LOC108577941 [Habropoda laboriosa]|uniref:uncharacterized protein LOC108577941 n=1 Tax=Habropoda laboriosa TaxID=597456 RepID=UPI00083D0DC1|nr:PREDICTED: uncharacterized protein LOC108577941 [Habropoda laboriosa]